MYKKGAIAVESRSLSVPAPLGPSDRQLELIPGLTIVDAVPSSDRQALDGLARIAHWEADRLSHFARTRATLAKEGHPTPSDVSEAIREIRTAALELMSMADTFISRLAAGKQAAASDGAL